MPKDQTISSILVIGSGPIIIGQAAEFDYAGTQACMALKEEGYRVILVNNNPATIMTDQTFADAIYFEPLTVDVLEKIIAKERPDGLLATLGGQTGLNLAFQLNDLGILANYGVKMLGTSIDSIKKGEDRQAFRTLMHELGEPVPESMIVHNLEEAFAFAEQIGYPIIIRPAYTLGGTGGGIAGNHEEFKSLVQGGLKESPIHQCLIERSIAGFKEVEYEVMRDETNTCIIICNMENFDPVGIHTGDSIVVAPSQTLTDVEYQMLRSASIKIISALGIVGGCNIQFALDPNSKDYYLIEVNPRVSRSSALASKATGYPIARMAAKLSVGYHLSELVNPVTGDTFASFEPALDYVIVKFPKWPFDKFPAIDRKLGTQMKATGETMGIDRNFERALQKAIRSLELKVDDLQIPRLQTLSLEELHCELMKQNDERFFILMELIRRGASVNHLHDMTKIDPFFLHYLVKLVAMESEIRSTNLEQVTKGQLQKFKEKGFSDLYLAKTWNIEEAQFREFRKSMDIVPAFKMVDTCAAEFDAVTNYYYSTYFGINEQQATNKRKIAIIGSGPIRIGQGIEFDYCSVHGVFALKEEGIETIMINNNPETVSTDFATADRLYFEPLTVEDVMNVLEAEQTNEVIIQLGGQTAINLADGLEKMGVKILGTSSAVIDQLEEREKFYQLLDQLQIPRLEGTQVYTREELHSAVESIGLPVLIRPSYVIGGLGMVTIHTRNQLQNFIENTELSFPYLVDRFLLGKEAEIDAVSDGVNIIAPVVMEHIERTGVHSGDSFSVIPPQTLSIEVQQKMLSYVKSIVKHTNYKGLLNIQYIIDDEEVYVLEVNPRASRTVPIISKMTGIPLVQIATKILPGKYKLSNSEEMKNLINLPYVCVKYPVFSNYALKGLDPKVSPEMRSTGEGICIALSYKEALRKAFHVSLRNKNFSKVAMKQAHSTSFKDFNQEYLLEVEDLNVDLIKRNKVAAYYNPDHGVADQREREVAIRNRLITFSEKETVEAFLVALTASSIKVQALDEWLSMIKEDVKLA